MVVESQRQIESNKILGKELTTNKSMWLGPVQNCECSG